MAYNPDLIPIGATASRAWNDETGVIAPKGALTDEEFRYIVFQATQDAATYIDSYIAPERERAMAYFLGREFGNEERGRSRVVLTEVRDTVLAMLPSLLRYFTGNENVVEFIPRQPEDIEAAKQATELVNYVFFQENPGFRVLHDAIKDALILKTGILNWTHYYDESVERHSYSGLSQEEMQLILSDPAVVLESVSEEIIAVQTPFGEQVQEPRVSLTVRRITRTPRYRIEAIPPEQFLIDNEATSLDDALFVGRRKLATISELVAMGYPRDVIEMNAGTSGFEMNNEVLVRNPADQSFFGITNQNDESTDKVYYVECYIRVDRDGDGIAEMHKVCTVGNGGYILHSEIVQEIPFAILSPDPTPHTIFGQSIADQTMDLQLMKSSIMRNMLDSLAQAIHPRTVVVEGQVNLDDVLNNETGAVIRARAPGAVQPLATPFVGQPALGVLAYIDEIKTQRTGISRTSQGLDADVLQSTTRAAVQAQLSASQDRIEMIARLFADGLKRCFQGVLRMLVQHQDKAKIMRLRNRFVAVDPRGWDASMDMTINVALGRGSDEQRLGFLQVIAAKQEEILKLLGPANPLVDMSQYRATLAQMIELAGFRDPSQFVKEVDPQAMMQLMQNMQQQPRMDPAQMLAQVEAQKIQADIVINAARQELDRQKAMVSADFERDKLMVDAMLKAYDIQAKTGAQVDMAVIRAEVDRQRAEMQALFRNQQMPGGGLR
jgi:hypothetical protein